MLKIRFGQMLAAGRESCVEEQHRTRVSVDAKAGLGTA